MTGLTVRVLDRFGELEALEFGLVAAWQASPSATPFQSPAWLIPWWDVFGPGVLAVHAVYAGDELVGLAPLYHERGRGVDAFCRLASRSATSAICSCGRRWGVFLMHSPSRLERPACL